MYIPSIYLPNIYIIVAVTLSQLHYGNCFTDGAIEIGKSTREGTVDSYSRPKFIKDILAQTGGNALLPCRFNGPGIVSIHTYGDAYVYIRLIWINTARRARPHVDVIWQYVRTCIVRTTTQPTHTNVIRCVCTLKLRVMQHRSNASNRVTSREMRCALQADTTIAKRDRRKIYWL